MRSLNYQEELRKQNKSLSTEDPINYSKLVEYSVIMSGCLHWFERNHYLELIMDFLNYKIDGKEFDEKFSKMVRRIEEKIPKNSQELKRIEFDSRSLGFEIFISEIYLCCEEFYAPNEGEDPALKTEEELRDAVKNLLTYIQK